MEQTLILVDEQNNVTGYGEKLQVHQDGHLHRAFSLFVVNGAGQLMLQRRAIEKYHSGGLWANTCCSHPLKGEDREDTIHRRLLEEMGFDCELRPMFHFIYRAELDNGLTEYELDQVYIGFYEEAPLPNPDEVCDWKWMDIEELKKDIVARPGKYVYWLKAAFNEFYLSYQELLGVKGRGKISK
jgi:isopentenyl-diphosphate delta-isomerase